jgi:3D (Asp-Asp-Asp) domain-containing protein
MKKLIILLQIIAIIFLLNIEVEQADSDKFYYMTCTAYSNHPNCISDKYRDGLTATGVPIREGIIALNVDMINGKWQVKSPLNLGDKIYIEGLGYFDCLDTGYFTDTDYRQDYWNVDVYMEDYDEAVEFGRQLRKVYVIKENK